MTANRLSCEDKNECDWHPCGLGGKCENVEDGGGWTCDCPLQGFRCDNCSCDEEPGIRHSSAKVGLGGDALAVIIFCLLFNLSKIIIIVINFVLLQFLFTYFFYFFLILLYKQLF